MKVEHRLIYGDPVYYCGWPANHGAWSWGDGEMLVGFLRGPYAFENRFLHAVGSPLLKHFLRSTDGGDTWCLEQPNTNFAVPSNTARVAPASVGPDSHILRFCGHYDHGGEDVAEGAFYASDDRGRTWSGPYSTGKMPAGAGDYDSSRTNYLGDLFFLSAGQGNAWGADRSWCAQLVEGEFRFRGSIAPAENADGDRQRAVMPAVARVGSRLVAALRRRHGIACYVEAFASDDEGFTWRSLGELGDTGRSNGNPGAVLALPDGRLLAAWGNRTDQCIVGRISEDQGDTWLKPFRIRADAADRDIGYPRLLMRPDGRAMCIYYWSSVDHPEQHIAASVLEL